MHVLQLLANSFSLLPLGEQIAGEVKILNASSMTIELAFSPLDRLFELV